MSLTADELQSIDNIVETIKIVGSRCVRLAEDGVLNTDWSLDTEKGCLLAERSEGARLQEQEGDKAYSPNI